MTRRWLPIGALAATLVAMPQARAQAPPGEPSAAAPAATGAPATAMSPEAARAVAAEAAEDLALVRILASLQLTPVQRERLVPFLESAQKQLREADEAARAALAGPMPRLVETRRALLAGQNPSNRAEGQIAEQSRIHGGKIRQLRADLVTSLRRTLSTLLSASQQTALAETARSQEVRSRTARQMGRAMNTGRGGRNLGPANPMARALDRARAASEANYPQARMEIAMQLAGAGRRAGGQAGLSPDDPQVQQRLGPILAMIDQARRMPDVEYQTGRADLAMQLWARRAEMGGAADPAETSEAIDEMLDRYFLSPRMVEVMRGRMERRS